MPKKKKTSDLKKIISDKFKGEDITKKSTKSKPLKKSAKDENEVVVSKLSTDSEDAETDLRIILRSYPHTRMEFETYKNIPIDRQITKTTDIGTRIIVAKYPAFYKIYFMEYIDIGKPHFPIGGIKVYNLTFGQVQYFYYDAVALHPTKKDKYRIKDVE